MKANNEIMLIADKTIPAVFKNEELTYNAGKNIFLTRGYTSQAGNTYFQGVRFSDRIIIIQQIGHGYLYTFLNGIQIFGFNRKDTILIAKNDYDCCIYNESYVRNESQRLIKEFLKSQTALSGSFIENKELDDFSRTLVAETMKNLLPYRNQLNT